MQQNSEKCSDERSRRRKREEMAEKMYANN